MEHSKLPWYVKEPTSCICATLDGVPDIKIAEADIIQNNWKANAAFIVKAVNCHDELLEACKDCLCFIQELSDRGIVSDWSGEKDLINVIAKAEEK